MSARRNVAPWSPRGVGLACLAVAAAILLGVGIASAAGAPPPGLVLVGASGPLLVGVALLLGGRVRGSRTRPLVLLAAALGALLLVPLVHSAGMAYGASWLEWDPVHATNVAVERPAGFAVLVASLVVCAALLAFAVVAALAAVVRAVRRGAPQRSAQ
jgi:hypothetical protein